jgi:flagellar motility protein MotE (MotC chaperone)
MPRRIWEFVSILSVAHVVAFVVLLLLLVATGGLNLNKMKLIRDVVLDRPLPTSEAPTSQPDEEGEAFATAGRRIADERVETQIKQLQIEQQMRELKDFHLQLEQAKAALNKRIADFEAERKRWTAQLAVEKERLASEGFSKSLALYESIQPDKAKDLFMTMDDHDVVRFLSAMDPRKAANIAKTFETPGEKLKLKRILTVMENPDEPAGEARADSGQAAPQSPAETVSP